MVECFCEDWISGMSRIVDRIDFESYTGSTFRYCPWCGESLSNVDETVKELDELRKENTRIDRDIALLQEASTALLERAKKLKEKK
jgi:hypothetical protein